MSCCSNRKTKEVIQNDETRLQHSVSFLLVVVFVAVGIYHVWSYSQCHRWIFVVVSFSCEVLSQCGFICIPKVMPVGTMTMYCDGML